MWHISIFSKRLITDNIWKSIKWLFVFFCVTFCLLPFSSYCWHHVHHQQTIPINCCCRCLPWRCSWRCMLSACHLISCLSSIALTALWCPLALWRSCLSTWGSCPSWASLCSGAYACFASSKSPGGIAVIWNVYTVGKMAIIHLYSKSDRIVSSSYCAMLPHCFRGSLPPNSL